MKSLKSFALAALQGDNKAVVRLAVVALAVIGVVAYLFTGQSSTETVLAPMPSGSPEVSFEPATAYVHISGQVHHPGVYQVTLGARLFEVVALAGGFTKKADQSSVNLARPIDDGEQVEVSRVGQAATTLVNGEKAGNASAKISINRASSQELESLPGVGPKLAGRIIDWRGANGGFAHIADLLEVGGIGDKLYAAIKPLVAL
ncbi:MAG: helix-hairpin-helix domain-containing protein [Microbacteriaceae bacterium]